MLEAQALPIPAFTLVRMHSLCRAYSRRTFGLLSVRHLHASGTLNAITEEASSTPSAPPEVTNLEPKKWNANSIRTGLIARKRGMTAVWNDQGVRVPVTILQVSTKHRSRPVASNKTQIENCQVTANVRTVRRDHTVYHAVQVAASDRPEKTTTRQMLGHFKKAGVPPKRIVKEFPVTKDALVPVGEWKYLLS